jgi:hypothetical protein
MTDDGTHHKHLAEALGDSLKAIDAAYKEEMRELRALFHDAKQEAEKDEPDSVKLKALLADANEAARTFSILDPAWQVVQRVSKMLGFL